jgi:hypothetical protein
LLPWGREMNEGSVVKKGKTRRTRREVTNVSLVSCFTFLNHPASNPSPRQGDLQLQGIRHSCVGYRFTGQKIVSDCNDSAISQCGFMEQFLRKFWRDIEGS